MTAQIRVEWRGHRSWWGARLFGGGQRFQLETAEAIAAELRGRGHRAQVERDGSASPFTGQGLQLGLFGHDRREDNE